MIEEFKRSGKALRQRVFMTIPRAASSDCGAGSRTRFRLRPRKPSIERKSSAGFLYVQALETARCIEGRRGHARRRRRRRVAVGLGLSLMDGGASVADRYRRCGEFRRGVQNAWQKSYGARFCAFDMADRNGRPRGEAFYPA